MFAKSQDTSNYITSECLYQVLKSDGSYDNKPPSIINFSYANDSLSISGIIQANCGSAHISIIEKRSDTLFIDTQDTGRMTTCDCEFEFNIHVKALATDTLINFNGKFYNSMHPYQGINNPDINNALNIFPNPSGDYILVKYQSNQHIKKIVIIDAAGKVVHTISDITNAINLKGLNKGSYFLRFEMENGDHVYRKIVKN